MSVKNDGQLNAAVVRVCAGLSWPLTGGSSVASTSSSSAGGQQVAPPSGIDRHSNDRHVTSSAQLVDSLQQLKDVIINAHVRLYTRRHVGLYDDF